jgi:uncharacterized protein Veg
LNFVNINQSSYTIISCSLVYADILTEDSLVD